MEAAAPEKAEETSHGDIKVEAITSSAAEPPQAAAAQGESEGEAPSAATMTALAQMPHLSAEARPFIPGDSWSGAAAQSEAPADPLFSQLPMRHRQMLRRQYMDQHSGEWAPYYLGKLKSYSNVTGYGFVECAATERDWGMDVFIHKNFVPVPWNLGSLVEFACSVNNRGQPQAVDCQWLPRLPQNRSGNRPGAGMTPNSNSQVGFGSVSQTAVAAKAASRPQRENTGAEEPEREPEKETPSPYLGGDRRFLGHLKSFSPAQGYGFITQQELTKQYQRDVYLDKSQLPISNWTHGQVLEFAITLNARGHPQARYVEWGPVPNVMTSPESNQGDINANKAKARNYSPDVMDKLGKLLKQLHENNAEGAVISAIDLQGGNGEAEAKDNPGVDFVAFVLDRLGSEENAIAQLKGFVQMLLLLMLAKMIRRWLGGPRCGKLVSWFDALAGAINPFAERVLEHLDDVFLQIKSHTDAAQAGPVDGENPSASELRSRLDAAVEVLQGKLDEIKK